MVLLRVYFFHSTYHYQACHPVNILKVRTDVHLAFSERTLIVVLEPYFVQELAEGVSYHCPECRKAQGSGTPLKRKLADKYVLSFLSILSFLGSVGNTTGVFI